MGDQRTEGVYPLQVILDALPVPIFHKDAQGFYRGCNKAFERYLGRPRGRILGLPVEGLSPPALGTGLGLAISHSIVTGLGGAIEVESQVGSGTVFRVRLPEAPSAEVRPVT